MLTCNAAAKAFSQASAWLQAATVLQVLEAWEAVAAESAAEAQRFSPSGTILAVVSELLGASKSI